ncbi:MAG: glycosyl transferase [bacterium]
MKYGYFDEAKREYIITNPETPTPWINYLGSDEYCALISNNAGGYSFYLSPKSGRFTRFRYNNLPMDRPGRYLYIRDNETSDYWTTSWQPVGKNLKDYKNECRHGLGYTKILSSYANIDSETTYFVPLGESLEIWMLKVKNNDKKDKDLNVFSYMEFAFWDAISDLTDFQYLLNVCRNTMVEDTQIINYDVGTYVSMIRPKAYAFTTNKIAGWDGDRDVFMGPHRSERNPIAVEKGESFNSKAIGGNPCASFNVKVKLKPGEEKTLVYVVGFGSAKKEGVEMKKKYSDIKNVDKELKKLSKHWDNNLSSFSCNTPDEITNQMLNVLNQYQLHTTFNWSRSASYYESGTHRDGLGYRDSHQDALAAIPSIPGRVRARIISLAGAIYQAGCASHIFQPLTGEGAGGRDYSDDHLWLILTTAAYIRETGDVAILDEQVPYLDGEKKDSLMDHIEQTIKYSLTKIGNHGLCLGLHADWNDTLNLSGQGESVWTTQLLCLAINEWKGLAELTGKKDKVNLFDKDKEKLHKAIEEEGWDGKWYRRAYTHSGRKIGSDESETAKIFLNPNTWAVMSGVADKERGIKLMDSVHDMLDTEYGLMLLAPPFETYDKELGLITLYPPAIKENGGIFAHANPWAVIAEAMLGRGDLAFKYYKTITPLAFNDIAEIKKTEPYIYVQFLAGKGHQHMGESRNSWLTGSASWNFVAATQYILGIKPEYQGLMMDPCIPKEWDGFTVKRKFRGTTYDISVKNPDHVFKGVTSVTVDGKKIDGNILPVFKDDNKVHKVEVVMG